MIPDTTTAFLQKYFTKIFVVSVPRLSERHKEVSAYLQPLPFDLFFGVDKQHLNIEAVKEQGVYDEVTAKKMQRQPKSFNSGEVACSLSHRMLYETIVKNQWEKVLILEDDVLPLQSVLDSLPNAINELPGDWDLVYLGYIKHEKVTAALRIKQCFYKILSTIGLMKWDYKMVCNLLPKPYSKYLKKAGFHDCTHAYAITLRAAKKLLAAQTPVIYRADDLLSSSVMKGDLNAFITEPKFFDQQIFHNAALKSEIH